MNKQTKLTPEQQHMVDQTIATLRIEDMEPSKDCIKELGKIASGEKTVEQSIRELDARYRQ